MIKLTFRDTFSTLEHKIRKFFKSEFEILRSKVYLISYNSEGEKLLEFIVSIEGIERKYIYDIKKNKYKRTINLNNLPLPEQKILLKVKSYEDAGRGYSEFINLLKLKKIKLKRKWFIIVYDNNILIVGFYLQKKEILCTAQINRINRQLIVFESELYI